jgi:hypothetical protein
MTQGFSLKYKKKKKVVMNLVHSQKGTKGARWDCHAYNPSTRELEAGGS